MRLSQKVPGAAGIGLAVGVVCLFAAGCHTDMWRQPKALPQEPFDAGVFADGKSDRLPVEGTVPFDGLHDDDPRYRAYEGKKLVAKLPEFLVINGKALRTANPTDLRLVLERGRERFDIFCTPCHGALGDGNGMITQRGLALRRKPASYHTDRLRHMPIGHFFDVITNGYGVMFSYASRVETNDRWAIAAYIRALQLSQNAKAADLSPDDAKKLQETPSPQPQEAHAQ